MPFGRMSENDNLTKLGQSSVKKAVEFIVLWVSLGWDLLVIMRVYFLDR